MVEKISVNTFLAGRRVGFIGKLVGMNRQDVKQMVRTRDGFVSDVLDCSIDLLVVGDGVIALDELEIEDAELSQSAAIGKTEVMTETDFWQALGMMEADEETCQWYTPSMLADLLKIPVATIRRWYRRGFIQPVHRVHKLPYFDFQEVAVAKRIAELLQSNQASEKKLAKLLQMFPDLHRPWSKFTLVNDGANFLLQSGDHLLESSGQRRFNFDETEKDLDSNQNVISIEPAAVDREIDQLRTPGDFIELATELEDDGEIESACEVYRSMMLAFGPTADICFRLAENLFQVGDLSGARERYHATIELDEEFVEARANLGCLLVEMGKPELAISAFEGALDYHPDYADVVFHLARQLDNIGQNEDAEIYWRQFLKLAPKSPWADEAKNRIVSDDESG